MATMDQSARYRSTGSDPQGRDSAAGRLDVAARGPRHSRGQPRLQFRRARTMPTITSPHRPNGARRSRRHRDSQSSSRSTANRSPRSNG
jgi:hypothetical protein